MKLKPLKTRRRSVKYIFHTGSAPVEQLTENAPAAAHSREAKLEQMDRAMVAIEDEPLGLAAVSPQVPPFSITSYDFHP